MARNQHDITQRSVSQHYRLKRTLSVAMRDILTLDETLLALSIVADWQISTILKKPLHPCYEADINVTKNRNRPTYRWQPIGIPHDSPHQEAYVAVDLGIVDTILGEPRYQVCSMVYAAFGKKARSWRSHSLIVDFVYDDAEERWIEVEQEEMPYFCPINIVVEEADHTKYWECTITYHPLENTFHQPAINYSDIQTERGTLIMQQIFLDMHNLAYQEPIEYLALYDRDLVTVTTAV